MREWKEGTVTISARVDIVAFAKCAIYIDLMGQPIRSKSDLLWTLVQMYASYAEKKAAETEMECMPSSVEQAVSVLNTLGLSVTGNDRQRRQVARSLQQQTLREDFGVSMQTRQTVNMSKGADLPADIASFDVFEERMQRMYPYLSKIRLHAMYEEEIERTRKAALVEAYPAQTHDPLSPEGMLADLAEQVAQAEARQKAERAALLQVPTGVVVSAPAKPVEDV